MSINRQRKVLNIAHRGASGYAPENTIASFIRAMELGADMIELDIHRSADGHLVVIHDKRLTRVGKKRGTVDKMILEELKTIDIGSWFGESYRGERIPTLKEVLELTRDRIELNLEIKKGDRPYELIEKVLLDLIGEYGMHDKILISSFYYQYLKNIRMIERSARIGLLVDKGGFIEGLKEALSVGAETINLPTKMVTEKAIEMAKAEGLKLYVYTVDNTTDMERYMEMGVDGIFTNYPDRLKQLLSV